MLKGEEDFFLIFFCGSGAGGGHSSPVEVMEYVVCSIAGCGLPGHQDGNRQLCKMNCPSGAAAHRAARGTQASLVSQGWMCSLPKGTCGAEPRYSQGLCWAPAQALAMPLGSQKLRKRRCICRSCGRPARWDLDFRPTGQGLPSSLRASKHACSARAGSKFAFGPRAELCASAQLLHVAHASFSSRIT